MSLQVFRDAYTRDGGNIDFGEMHASGDLAAGSPTPWYNLTPRKGKTNVLGVIFKCIYVLTATTPAAPQAGTDALDPILNGGQIDIGGTPGAAGRSQSLTRQFVEFLYAALTNTSFSIAALPTFASAGTSTVTVSFFVGVGGPAAAARIRLPSAILGASTFPPFPYASGVTVSYTSITSQIVSTTFTGVCAFREEKSASLGSGMQSYLQYIPKDVAPDAAFLPNETSSTITQVLITDDSGFTELQSTDTDALQIGAAGFAPISGATYTTTAGFVMTLDGRAFSSFQLNFASAAVHWSGFVQVKGGETALPNINPSQTAAPAAVNNVGTVTAGGQVASAQAGKAGKGTSGRVAYRRR